MTMMGHSEEGKDAARLFFGAHVVAPWPEDYPNGRIIEKEMRHITLCFLGEKKVQELKKQVDLAPRPDFQIGPAGIGSSLVFLPPESNRVVALNVEWLDQAAPLNTYQIALQSWVKMQGYPIDQRPFFPHVTLARAPFERQSWERHFTPLPLFTKGIHLYQSLGNLKYRSLWEIPLLPPFEEFEHTADIAFHIVGTTPQQLHQHAELALAFQFPPLIPFFAPRKEEKLEEIIIALNELVGKADAVHGCPFKAVSFHGKIIKDPCNLLHWEMIVDV